MISAVPATIRVEFFTDDPKMVEILNGISEFNEFTSCRHELEGRLYQFLAEKAFKTAAIHKQAEVERDRRRQKREQRVASGQRQ